MKRLLLALLLPLAVYAQVRYQFGDDPKWADPRFDDSSWPVAEPGRFPMPPEGSNGMVWLRYRVPAPPDQSPLAVRLARENGACTPGEFWINGVRIASQGQFPPQPLTLTLCQTNVFDLPGEVVQPGEPAVFAWRGWVAPIFTSGIEYAPPVLFGVEIGPRDYVRSRENEVRASGRLASLPDLILNLLQLLIALSVLAVWWRTRTQTLFWFAAFTLAWSAMGLLYRVTVAPGMPHLAYWSINWAGWLAFELALIQFMKCASGAPRWPILALRTLCLAWCMMPYFPVLLVTGSLSPVHLPLNLALGVALFLGHMALALWMLVRGQRETRGLAITLFLAGLAYLLVDNLGIVTTFRIGEFLLTPDNLFTTLVIIAMCYLLLSRLWADWRKKEELDAEFEAAREMQESLVQQLPETPGFVMETAYRPASHVGGDFYRVFTANDGALLVVAGDVSGKGLKAAMTVSVLAGAMESIETREPGLFLTKLNRAAMAHVRSGFVTCCAALIRRNGEAVIANAGHLAPYRDGREVEVDAGLPLGIVTDASYTETTTHGDRFVFVSDGEVEAENARRELFGFDRTRSMSVKPAREIAEAAQAWGQNDDITVVTVRRVE
jgi:hypothetical protein